MQSPVSDSGSHTTGELFAPDKDIQNMIFVAKYILCVFYRRGYPIYFPQPVDYSYGKCKI